MKFPIQDIDAATIFLIKSQDEATRTWVMKDYSEFGFRYLLTHYTPTFTEAECKDIANSCVITLIVNIELDKYQYQPTTKTTTYFTQIVRNTAESYRKKRLKTKDNADIETVVATTITQPMEEEQIDLEALLLTFIKTAFSKRMKQNCQKMIILKHIKKMRHKAIAKRMKYTDKHSRNRLYRCMKHLRKYIETQLAEQDISRAKLLTYLMKNG